MFERISYFTMLSSSQLSGDNEDGETHPDNDRNTKKVRFKDNLVEDDISMDGDPAPEENLSWKDKLLGGSSGELSPNRIAFSEGSDIDFELLEGDVNKTILDGVPAISFSDRLKNILVKFQAVEDYNRVLSQGP